jgi:hypothetical protein
MIRSSHGWLYSIHMSPVHSTSEPETCLRCVICNVERDSRHGLTGVHDLPVTRGHRAVWEMYLDITDPTSTDRVANGSLSNRDAAIAPRFGWEYGNGEIGS